MTVSNTGNETVGIQFADPAAGAPDAGCDAGTLSATPTVLSGTYTPGAAGNGYGSLPTLTAGSVVVYTCRHAVRSTDNPWVNVAGVSGVDINGTPVSTPNATVQNSAVNPERRLPEAPAGQRLGPRVHPQRPQRRQGPDDQLPAHGHQPECHRLAGTRAQRLGLRRQLAVHAVGRRCQWHHDLQRSR